MAAIRSSSDARRAPSLKVLASLFLAGSLAACASSGGPPAPIVTPSGQIPTPTPAPGPQTRAGLTPPFMAGKQIVRIGVLLPFSTPGAEAQSLLDAAELAMFDHGDATTMLMPRDSGTTQASADAAARDLLALGADAIVGPVSKDQVAGVSLSARPAHVPVIAFSTDRAVAGQGVYLLTYPFEEEVARIVDYATLQGVKRFAILAPEGEYGRRVDAAFRQEVGRRQGAVVAGGFYPATDKDAATAAKNIALQARATGAQALLIPDSGSRLRSIGQTLLQANFDKQIKLLGTSLWAADAQKEPSLSGGWYAAPDPALRAAFDARYRAAYNNRAPSRLAGLAYDAIAVSETLSRDVGGRGLTDQALQSQDGFLGADGVFRFQADGTVQRGLAVLEVRPGAPAVIDAAPKALTNRGS